MKNLSLTLLFSVAFAFAGFAQSEAETTTVTVYVEGMTCPMGCAAGIDKKFETVEGVVSSETSFDEGTSTITYNPSLITEEQVVQVIVDKGYTASLEKGDAETTTHSCSNKTKGSCCTKK